jgi:hypothetical protein
VRVKKWWCDELLVEPEIVGGRIQWNEIQLRAGERNATINLGWLDTRREQAAVVEHCSQFLSTEQQAAYGSDWSQRYHRLLTPPKPTCPLRLLRVFGITYGIGMLILILAVEWMVATYSVEMPIGESPRWLYQAWFVVGVMFCMLPLWLFNLERAKQLKQIRA